MASSELRGGMFAWFVVPPAPQPRLTSRLVVLALTFSLTTCGLASLSPARSQAAPTDGAVTAATRHEGPPPTLVVHFTRPAYTIKCDPKTGAVSMPADVKAYARLEGWPADVPYPKTFMWHVYLDWDDKVYPTHHSISGLKFERPSPLPVNFGNEIRGGRLKVIAKAVLDGKDILGTDLAEIRGENPPRAAVLRCFPPNRIGLIASKIATAESGMHQFDTVTGMPMISRTNDVGMMQLNAPTGSVTSADQVWDWRANLRQGLEIMSDKRRITVLASRGNVNRQPDLRDLVLGYEDAACVNYMRWYLGLSPNPPPVIPPLSTQPGSGVLPGEADPDHVALSQMERDAIRRYNGGREYALALVTDPATLTILTPQWQVDPTRGGVRVRSGDPEYITHVLRAHSGFVIPPPAKPHKLTRHARRHRRK